MATQITVAMDLHTHARTKLNYQTVGQRLYYYKIDLVNNMIRTTLILCAMQTLVSIQHQHEIFLPYSYVVTININMKVSLILTYSIYGTSRKIAYISYFQPHNNSHGCKWEIEYTEIRIKVYFELRSLYRIVPLLY